MKPLLSQLAFIGIQCAEVLKLFQRHYLIMDSFFFFFFVPVEDRSVLLYLSSIRCSGDDSTVSEGMEKATQLFRFLLSGLLERFRGYG